MPPPSPISSTKPPCRPEDALAVLKRLRAAGHVAYFAGGCVRDLLMGKEPKDWDVATDAPPNRVRALFANTQAVGAAFGVILIRIGPSTIEVATFRAEGVYSDGRRPDSVRFTTAAEDARRRDFTINGLFLDPVAEGGEGSGFGGQGSGRKSPSSIVHGQLSDPQFNESTAPTDNLRWTMDNGQWTVPPLDESTGAITDNQQLTIGNAQWTVRIHDFVGGLADLRDKILRAIGDPADRFAEDHLRLLRAIRFAARFGLTIEPATAAAIRVNAPRLIGISPERIADELRLMLNPSAPSRAAAWTLLWEYALVDVIMRFIPMAGGHDPQAGPANPPVKSTFNPGRSLFLALDANFPISFGLALAAGALDFRIQPLAASSAATAISPQSLQSQLIHFTTRPEIAHLSHAMRQALRISNEEVDELIEILSPLPSLLADAPPRLSAQKRFLAKPTAPATRQLLAALSALHLFTQPIAALESLFEKLESTGQDMAPPPLVTGDDLIALGLKPGPKFRHLLDRVYDAQLENEFVDKQAALECARNWSQGQEPAAGNAPSADNRGPGS